MNKNVIDDRLKEIEAVIPFNLLLNRDSEEKTNIARYYRLNRLAYRLVNSKQGFVHMGISRDGVFKEGDFLEHANIISKKIEESQGTTILELAAGKAATTKYLADKYGHFDFTGLDLPLGQLDIRSTKLPNLKLVEGDYHDLSQFANESFDIVYIIEALCHARSKAEVIKEVFRVLRPKGIFIIFDGYTSKKHSDMTKKEALISDLTYTSMMVTKNGHLYSDLKKNLTTSGFRIIEEENLSRYVLPSMARLESKAAKYFKHPRAAKLANKIFPIEVTGNAVAAYLMPLSVDAGLHEYWLTIATKK
jgi:ubiquinone/menaquinone biosynthesis C-methylase UbiE